MKDAASLINDFLDDTLDGDGQAALDAWIAGDPGNARLFANEVRLHDRLRDVLRSNGVEARPAVASETKSSRYPRWSVMAALTAAAAVVFWFGFHETPASAAAVELDRIIAANPSHGDHAYRIDVEEVWTPARRGRPQPEDGRPPKEPLDGALLCVRGDSQFVLDRAARDGGRFLTGSDGVESWAVRPDGSVRVSDDPGHFLRDVPGHEHQMPLGDVAHTFERLRGSYELRELPVEDAPAGEEPARLFVAVRKTGQRGPQRVEITYGALRRAIRAIRFVGMPFGPDRLTLRITPIETQKLGDAYFRHSAHHEAGRRVEREHRE